jgi:LytR cell envelope-related transcriptional attenuator
MTTPDPKTPGQTAAGKPSAGDSGSGPGAWGAVARLLSLQLLTVIAVTAVITGVYALTGPHRNHQVAAGSSAPASATGTATGTAAPSKPGASATPTSTPPGSLAASASAPASPKTSQPKPEAADRLKVDVLNQSGQGGTAAKLATRVRDLGWTIGRVGDFRGNVTATTVYYPTGEARAARELAGALPGKPRVLPRFSTLADNRLTIIITR